MSDTNSGGGGRAASAMAQTTGGLLPVGVAARVPASAVRAGLNRQGREPELSPRSGAAEEPEAGP
ncbi:hypothetical protein GEV49_07465 [Streptomyces sp. SYP-A7193]|nr:hypothetical protein GEV49_07465 [Streptomyces sp. SYP-A7193]